MADFTLAHLSDPHLNPLPRIGWRELYGKRFTGYANWLRSRGRVHNMAVLADVADDIVAAGVDHVACTGDVSHIGLPLEFERAAEFLRRFGPPEAVSFVPGNHDVYVASSLDAVADHLGGWITGDDGGNSFPWLKLRGHVALIGLSSGVATGVFMAWGRLGQEQIARARALLEETGRQGYRRVVLIHHPPHVGGAKKLRDLVDAATFEAVLAEAGADLVLHGHNHRNEIGFVKPAGGAGGGRRGIPILGVASASLAGGTHSDPASWNRIVIPESGPLTVERRIRTPRGFVGQMLDLG